MICSSVNRDRFIVRPPRLAGIYLPLEEFQGVTSPSGETRPSVRDELLRLARLREGIAKSEFERPALAQAAVRRKAGSGSPRAECPRGRYEAHRTSAARPQLS